MNHTQFIDPTEYYLANDGYVKHLRGRANEKNSHKKMWMQTDSGLLIDIIDIHQERILISRGLNLHQIIRFLLSQPHQSKIPYGTKGLTVYYKAMQLANRNETYISIEAEDPARTKYWRTTATKYELYKGINETEKNILALHGYNDEWAILKFMRDLI